MSKLSYSSTGDEPRAFFGRRSGKRLHQGQQALMDDLLPSLSISPESFPEAFDHPDRPVVLEIGYGGGEHLARIAKSQPDTNFIGAEVFTGGIGKMLEKIGDDELTNVRLFTSDALPFLLALPPASLDGVYLLYPDPWPKSRHHKRRFVSPVSLDALARVIKPGGFFRFASDIEDYANWTLAHIVRHDQFTWPLVSPGSWHDPYAGWQPTRYEQKARREGRLKSWYFTFVRR